MNPLKFAQPLFALALLVPVQGWLHAQGTAFTYQGRLTDAGQTASGKYDLQFYLRDALSGGNPVGPTNRLATVAVSNGLFIATLDFGTGIFTGEARWLEIGVRTNGSMAPYETLSPRQSITPAPYALNAATAQATFGIAVNSNGNVGIRTLTPNAALEVDGGIRIDGPSYNLRLSGGDGGTGGTEISFADDNDGLGSPNGGGFALRAFGTGASRQLSVARSDNENNRLLRVGYNGDVTAQGNVSAGGGVSAQKISCFSDFGPCSDGTPSGLNSYIGGLLVEDLWVKTIHNWNGSSVCVPAPADGPVQASETGYPLDGIQMSPAGLASTAVQELNQKLEKALREKDAEVQALKDQIRSLDKRLYELERASVVSRHTGDGR